jgi:hypothetical protein
VGVGDLITVRGREWIVDAIDGDAIHVAREFEGHVFFGTVTLDEIDSCEHEGRLLAALEELAALRKMIEVPRQSSSKLYHRVERIEAILRGETR